MSCRSPAPPPNGPDATTLKCHAHAATFRSLITSLPLKNSLKARAPLKHAAKLLLGLIHIEVPIAQVPLQRRIIWSRTVGAESSLQVSKRLDAVIVSRQSSANESIWAVHGAAIVLTFC
jgi:hypothetical protein